jgi:chromosome segregation ATPase
MRLSRLATAGIVSVSLLASFGCNRPSPVAASSAEQSGFAEEYPVRLSDIRSEFAEDEKDARKEIDAFKTYPAKLKNPDPAAMKKVIETADATGRSSYYADDATDRETAERFLTDDRGLIPRRVAGAVAYEAKQKECTVEDAEALGNTGAYALGRAADRQLEERRKAHSEVLRTIDSERHRLGRQNLETLERQAETIAHASYLTHVRLENARRELEGLLDEEPKVKKTLDRALSEDQAILADTTLPKSRKAAVEARVARTQAAQASLAKESPLAHPALDDMQKRLETLQKDYDAALKALLASFEGKPAVAASVEEEPPPAPASNEPPKAPSVPVKAQ